MKILRLTVALLVICGLLAGCGGPQRESIVVGSKDFTEQFVLGYMLTLLIEANTDLDVTYKGNMASHVVFAAISTGAVDVYIEYTGTIYGSYLQLSETTCYEEVFDISSREIKERHGLLMLDPLGFNNTFCLVISSDTAAEHNIRTFSDLAKVSSDFILGASAETLSRNDGIPGLKRAYDMSFKEERVIDLVLRYPAIVNDEIQVTLAYSTDGQLLEYNLVVLEDDKQFFPPYEGVVLIREETAQRHPELLEVLDRLAGALSDDTMRGLNYRVDVLGESPRDVAEGFLRENNFIN